ncbi:hypothetical protein [Pilimelia columellifera]|uniref:Uncharacterized protein n=1 Tax=Pilimelia columellifera subsp. columellifera TaxID=706583 RepID=A0ABN3NSA9_9ACTN
MELARLDRSGRLSMRAVLRHLAWRPGHRVDIDVVDGAILVVSTFDGTHRVGSRGDLALPAAARALCGLNIEDAALVVAAYPMAGVVLAHPAAVVARYLHQLHQSLRVGHGG